MCFAMGARVLLHTYYLLHMGADNFPSSIYDILPYLQGDVILKN